MNGAVTLDLRDQFGPVADQGQRGTCVAFAVTALHHQSRSGPTVALSEEYVFWSAKQRDGVAGDGTTFAAATSGLAAVGQSTAALWPYDPLASHLQSSYRPSDAAVADAATRLAVATSLMSTVLTIRSVLDDGRGVGFGVPVWDAFELTNGFDVVALPVNAAEMPLEHAVVIAGHDPSRRALLIRNSWGTRWGDGGYGWVDESLLTVIAGSPVWTVTPTQPPHSPT